MKLAFVAASLLALQASELDSAERLPFPDGTYATKRQYCEVGREAAINEYEFALYDINGHEISNYETFCKISKVKLKGNRITFVSTCESEGEATRSKTEWIRLNKSSFSVDGNVFYSCGRHLP